MIKDMKREVKMRTSEIDISQSTCYACAWTLNLNLNIAMMMFYGGPKKWTGGCTEKMSLSFFFGIFLSQSGFGVKVCLIFHLEIYWRNFCTMHRLKITLIPTSNAPQIPSCKTILFIQSTHFLSRSNLKHWPSSTFNNNLEFLHNLGIFTN